MTMTKVVVMDGSTDREEAVVDPRTIDYEEKWNPSILSLCVDYFGRHFVLMLHVIIEGIYNGYF